MNLAAVAIKAILGATKSARSAFVDATVFRKTSENYDPSTSIKTYSEEFATISIVFEHFKVDEIDGKIVKNYDVKLIALPKESTGFKFALSSVDRIEVDNQNFSIVVSKPQRVGNVIVAYMLHVRPQGV